MKDTPVKADRRTQNGQERRAKTRSTILDAAFQVLGNENGRLVRIDQVTEVAEIARPTFYTYFSSLEELFATLSFELNHEFNVAVLERAQSLSDAAEEIANAVRYYLHKARDDQQWGWSMVNLSLAGPVFGVEATQAAASSVEVGLESGLFKVADVRIGRDQVLGISLVSMRTMLTDETPENYPELVARHVLMGLGVTATKADRLIGKRLPELKF